MDNASRASALNNSKDMDNASGAAVVWIKRDMIHMCYVLKYCKINREGKYTRVTCHGSLNLRGQGRVSADAMLLSHSSHTRGAAAPPVRVLLLSTNTKTSDSCFKNFQFILPKGPPPPALARSPSLSNQQIIQETIYFTRGSLYVVQN
jgi:hypothetical protein